MGVLLASTIGDPFVMSGADRLEPDDEGTPQA